tara:strand:+ start:2862 stop:3671 length:810 start_codon:yes stop_codon:yes gene_type:complete
MNKNDTLFKTLIVGLVLCLVCSIVISSAAVGLRDQQKALKQEDQQSKILSSAGLLSDNKSIEEIFLLIEERVVNLETGDYEDSLDPISFDGKKFESEDYSKDPLTSILLTSKEDISSLKRRENFIKIYLYKIDNQIEAIILPIRGLGLWGTLYGYLAIEPDLNTIIGLEYFSHKETPGLGAEVDNPRWKAKWKGKKIFSSTGEVKIEVVKGLVNLRSEDKGFQVDGISGATITSRGVTNMLTFWLGEMGYSKFLDKLKQEINEEDELNV